MLKFFFLISSLFTLAYARSASYQFEQKFLFGIASAPAHIEDELHDSWISMGLVGKIPGFLQTPLASQRNQFWSNPDLEIDQLLELGVQVYRMGIDWQRLSPTPGSFDETAASRYAEIIKKIRSKNIKVMITLFHHSMPQWAIDQGGWVNPKTSDEFLDFSKKVVERLYPLVDYWITFNEPQIYLMATHYLNLWPNDGKKYSLLSIIDIPFWKGDLTKAMHFMAKAHEDIYQFIHYKNPSAQVGIAQHFSRHRGANTLGQLTASFTHSWMNFYFPDLLQNYDFMGVNYYGAEIFKNFSWYLSPDEEYSEAGRAIAPQDFYHLLQEIKTRYQLTPIKPIIITENGIADATDNYRQSYLLEHLAALHRAMKNGVPVSGYLFWTLMDNMEWADGYCPKFGLIEVIRTDEGLNFARRESFTLYQQLIKNRSFFDEDRMRAFKKYKSSWGKTRPFCRNADGMTGMSSAIQVPVKPIIFRFQESILEKQSALLPQ